MKKIFIFEGLFSLMFILLIFVAFVKLPSFPRKPLTAFIRYIHMFHLNLLFMDMHVLRGLCTIKMYMKIPDPFEIKTIP